MWNFYLRSFERREQSKRSKEFNIITATVGGAIASLAAISLIDSVLNRSSTLTISVALSIFVLLVVLPRTLIAALFLLRGERK